MDGDTVELDVIPEIALTDTPPTRSRAPSEVEPPRGFIIDQFSTEEITDGTDQTSHRGWSDEGLAQLLISKMREIERRVTTHRVTARTFRSWHLFLLYTFFTLKAIVGAGVLAVWQETEGIGPYIVLAGGIATIIIGFIELVMSKHSPIEQQRIHTQLARDWGRLYRDVEFQASIQDPSKRHPARPFLRRIIDNENELDNVSEEPGTCARWWVMCCASNRRYEDRLDQMIASGVQLNEHEMHPDQDV